MLPAILSSLPGQQFPDSPNSKKKLFQTDDFSLQNQKKSKNSKKGTEMYNKEDC